MVEGYCFELVVVAIGLDTARVSSAPRICYPFHARILTSSLVIKVSRPRCSCITSPKLKITRSLPVIWRCTTDGISIYTTLTNRTRHSPQSPACLITLLRSHQHRKSLEQCLFHVSPQYDTIQDHCRVTKLCSGSSKEDHTR